MARDKSYSSIYRRVVKATPRAICTRDPAAGPFSGHSDLWIPRSVILDGEGVGDEFEGSLDVEDWWLEQEGVG